MTATNDEDAAGPQKRGDHADAWGAWFAAAGLEDIDAALRDIHARIDAAVTARGPVCWASGRCCNFDAAGHRLYVTALEVAWVLRGVVGADGGHEESGASRTQARPALDAIDPHGACVFQIDGLCSIHRIRPLGCRIYFCQRGTEDWQHELYEQFLGDLRRLHEQHAIAYAYVEWRQGLIAARASRQASGR